MAMDELTYNARFFDGPMAGDTLAVPRVGALGNEVEEELEVRNPFGGSPLKYKHNGDITTEYFSFHVPPYVMVEAVYLLVVDDYDPDFYVAPPIENF